MESSGNNAKDLGPLLDPARAAQLERADRENPIPGGEPDCPCCGTKMTRLVEEHPSLHKGASPFRIRLVCHNQECQSWTVYNW